MITYLMALACVVALASGQMLFKASAAALERTGSWFHPDTLLMVGLAVALYGITSIGWILVLQRMPLARAYPLMALAFLLVPIGSWFFFDEKFGASYFIGVALIMAGIVVTVRS